MKLKVLVGILIILIVINLATIGSYFYMLHKHDGRFWHRPPLPWMTHLERPDRPPRERPGRALMQRLSRTEREQLTQLLTDLRMETEDLRTSIHTMESEVMEALRQDSIPLQRVDSLLKDIADIHLEISHEATNKLIEAKSYLSPEQQALFYDAILQAHTYGHGSPGLKGMFRDGPKRQGRQGRRQGR
jgi:hypothetical protein